MKFLNCERSLKKLSPQKNDCAPQPNKSRSNFFMPQKNLTQFFIVGLLMLSNTLNVFGAAATTDPVATSEWGYYRQDCNGTHGPWPSVSSMMSDYIASIYAWCVVPDFSSGHGNCYVAGSVHPLFGPWTTGTSSTSVGCYGTASGSNTYGVETTRWEQFGYNAQVANYSSPTVYMDASVPLGNYGIRATRTAGCPDGYTVTNIGSNQFKCVQTGLVPSKDYGNSPTRTCNGTNPINEATGNKYQTETDYVGAGASHLKITRYYNSGPLIIGGSEKVASYFGKNWTFAYNQLLTFSLNTVSALRPDGKSYLFVKSGASYLADSDITDSLSPELDGTGQTIIGWRYKVGSDDSIEEFDTAGHLTKITYRDGTFLTISYTVFTPDAPYVAMTSVTDQFGKSLTFSSDNLGRITQIADPAGGKYQYTYDTLNRLQSVQYPDNKLRTYVYNEPANVPASGMPFALTGIIDENNVRFATFKYDASLKAYFSGHAGGADSYTLSYGTDGSATITDPQGTARTYFKQIVLGIARNAGQNQPAGSGCGAAATAITYDANGNIASRTDFNGNRITYTYDLIRNLEIGRTEASGTAQARTITAQWHPTYRLPAVIAEPLRKTTFNYDGSGNLLSKTIQATTDTNGSQGLSAQVVGTPRTWSYSYNQYGQVLTAIGPRTDVVDKTTYSYDSSTGNLLTITNAAGQITTLSNYDANGRVGTITDPNGMVTNLTYYPRGWLKSKAVSSDGATQTTNYFYDGVGQLTSVNLPDNSSISYIYDPAHRLTDIADSLNNHIHYTLDNMGNRISEQVNDPSNVLVRQTTRIYDALNRLQQVTGATQ